MLFLELGAENGIGEADFDADAIRVQERIVAVAFDKFFSLPRGTPEASYGDLLHIRWSPAKDKCIKCDEQGFISRFLCPVEH